MSMILKRASVVLLALVLLVASFAACGNAESEAPESEASSAGTEVSEEESSEEESSEIADEEVVTLRIWGFTNSSSPDIDKVAEAISEITREKIGVEIEMTRSYDGEKLNLALTSGEQLDLVNFHAYSGGLAALVSGGYAAPLDDLIAEYGQDILEVVPEEYMACAKIDGVTYMIPNLKDTARSAGFAMRKDVLDELGIDPDTIKTWDDVHDVFVRVKEETDLYPLVSSWTGGGMQETIPYDSVGAGYGVLENVYTDSTTVVNLYETDSYREFCERMYQWNQEGLIMPDATTSTENNLVASIGFADYENIKPGKELEIKKAWGVDCVLVPMLETAYTRTGSVNGSSFFIPSASEYPEKAMQLWNLMYTDPEISNMFINGVEGLNWVYADETKEVIKAPEGLDSTTNGYESLDWAWPNMRITPVWEGADPDLWDQMNEFTENAVVSPAMGFVFDNSMVMNEITACNNVKDKYDTALRWGEMNPDEALPQFIDELKAAGVDTIVAEAQTQLNAWLEENK